MENINIHESIEAVALSTYYFVLVAVSFFACFLPGTALIQTIKSRVKSENQKVVHPNFNLTISRQRSVFGRQQYISTILQTILLFFGTFGLFALCMALHYLNFDSSGQGLSGFSRAGFVCCEVSIGFYLSFYFTLLKPNSSRKDYYIAATTFFSFSGLLSLLFLIFSLVPEQLKHFPIAFTIFSYLAAVRLFLVTFAIVIKTINCGDYKQVPTNVSNGSWAYYQSSRLVSLGFIFVSIIIAAGPVCFIVLGANSKVPIILYMGGLFLFSLITYIHHLDIISDSEQAHHVTQSIEQLTYSPFAQTNMDVVP